MKWIFSSVLFLLVGVSLFYGFSLRYNVSDSYPKGLYRVEDRLPSVGELVIFCLKKEQWVSLGKERNYIKPGFCSSGTLPLIKKLVAVAGDNVAITQKGISVNGGSLIKNTQVFTADSVGRRLPTFSSRRLQASEAFVISDYPMVS